VPSVIIAGLQTYYEVEGEGLPVVLLHAGLVGAESWSHQTRALVSAGYTVYAPERRGHGRTPDVPGPLSYSIMADETTAFLDQVVKQPAHVIGHSDGAVVGALVAMRRPDLVGRLVVIGQYFNPEGQAVGALDWLRTFRSPNDWIREIYDRLSPDGPEHLAIFLDKTVNMWEREPNIQLIDLAAITSPTLLLQGDDDIVRIEHSAAAMRSMPNARLGVLQVATYCPGRTQK
jgi:pimeloyl-ACP methyl ester carboxylesterase